MRCTATSLVARDTRRRPRFVDPTVRDQIISQVKKTGAIDNFEVKVKNADGHEFWIALSGRMIEYKGEDVLVVSNFDLSERIAAEEALRESEELIRRVLEACPVPLAMSRVESGEYIYISPANAEMLGIDKADGPIRAPDTFANPAFRRVYLKWLLESGRVDNLEVERIGADGEPFWASTVVAADRVQGRGGHCHIALRSDRAQGDGGRAAR